MKELHKDQIVTNYDFPFSEALSFSILLWTVWGLLEAFYLQKLAPLFLQNGQVPSLRLFLAAYFIYLAAAVIFAGIIYWIVRWLLFSMGKNDSRNARAITLTFILAGFFAAIINYSFHENFAHVMTPSGTQYGFFALSTAFALFLTVLLFFKAARVGFRMAQFGTPIVAVILLSIILAFVPFPVFTPPESPASNNRPSSSYMDLKRSAKGLMAYYYLGKVIPLQD